MSEKVVQLKALLKEMNSVLIGFSGGVDSTFLAAVATEVLGERVLCITADAPMIKRREIREAVELADALGLNHQVVHIDDVLQKPCMVEHPVNRCYFCKHGIFGTMKTEAEKRGIAFIVDGSNADDTSDYRPGMQALKEIGVRSPLLECGLTKQEIRDASQAMGLTTHDKPSAPCMATRIPFGTSVTEERLSLIEAAEEILNENGFREFRARLNEDELLIQINVSEIHADDFTAHWNDAKNALEELAPVTLDPNGLHKGYYADRELEAES